MKLHLGSGSRYLEGYLHVDIADYEHIDIKSSVDKLNTIDNDTVDEIYASHVLEYFDRNEVESVLNEWKRVLKKEGTCVGLANGILSADGKIIYKTENLKVGLFKS